MRLSDLLKKHTIREEEVEECFRILRWEFSSINKKITLEESEKILVTYKAIRKSQFANINSVVEQKPKQKPLPIQELPSLFNIKNSFEEETIRIVHDDNDIKNRESRIIEIDGLSVKTCLTDFEAFSICNGLKDAWSKQLSNDYFSGANDVDLIFSAHERAMETIGKYGDVLIFHLINLPPLPFKATNAHQIFTQLDNKKKITQDPIIRLLFEKEKIQFSFYKKTDLKNGRYYSNVLIARSKTKNEDLFLMSRDGRCIPLSKTRNIGPIIQTFISYSDNLEEHIIHYGLITGECSICGRELSDPDSVRIGIGPICREQLYS